MNNNELISIVVPIYNVEQYIRKCLDSIINQTYTNIEVLLIDDGSPDNCGQICDEYAKKDERIRVFHIPNGGVGKARQFGVEKSTGEYIIFVDPDDWLPLNSVEILYSNMLDDISICIGNHYDVCNGTRLKENCRQVPKEHIQIITASQYRDWLLGHLISRAPWGKLYRRNLFDNKSFPSCHRGQDVLMNIKISTINDKNILLIGKPIYYYLINSNTSTLKNYSNNYEKERLFILTMCDYFKSVGLYEHHKGTILEYALRRLGNILKCGDKLHLSDPLIKEIYENTRFKDLRTFDRCTKIVIRFPRSQSCFNFFIDLNRRLRRCISSIVFNIIGTVTYKNKLRK